MASAGVQRGGQGRLGLGGRLGCGIDVGIADRCRLLLQLCGQRLGRVGFGVRPPDGP
jgi:hypothetical protein